MGLAVTVGQAGGKSGSAVFRRALAANAVAGITVRAVGPTGGVAALGDPGGITGRAVLRRAGAADRISGITV